MSAVGGKAIVAAKYVMPPGEEQSPLRNFPRGPAYLPPGTGRCVCCREESDPRRFIYVSGTAVYASRGRAVVAVNLPLRSGTSTTAEEAAVPARFSYGTEVRAFRERAAVVAKLLSGPGEFVAGEERLSLLTILPSPGPAAEVPDDKQPGRGNPQSDTSEQR